MTRSGSFTPGARAARPESSPDQGGAMKTLFRKAQILAMGGPARRGAVRRRPPDRGRPHRGDRRRSRRDSATRRCIDGRDRLVMPGLVNAHLHSSEQFFKGRYERMPLEVWLLYAYPLLMGPQISERLLNLRSMLVAIESLKSGVTTICDDFFDPPTLSLERIGVVFSAYEAAGIRANVSNSIINIPALDALPFAREIVPRRIAAGARRRREGDAEPPMPTIARRSSRPSTARAGRLRYMISPSAPQRCTVDLLEACAALAIDHARAVPHPCAGDQDAGGHGARALRQVADPLPPRSRPPQPQRHHRPFGLGRRRRHEAHGRGRLLGRPQRRSRT